MAPATATPIPLIGCSPAPGVGPGADIGFMVSSTGPVPCEARLVRVPCADANPCGPGYREVEVDASLNGTYPLLFQPTALGSRAHTPATALPGPGMTRAATVWPTRRKPDLHAILAHGDPGRNRRSVTLRPSRLPQGNGHPTAEPGETGDAGLGQSRRASRRRCRNAIRRGTPTSGWKSKWRCATFPGRDGAWPLPSVTASISGLGRG